jgi:hypothetical protein
MSIPTEALVTKWLMDSSGYSEDIKKVAKELRIQEATLKQLSLIQEKLGIDGSSAVKKLEKAWMEEDAAILKARQGLEAYTIAEQKFGQELENKFAKVASGKSAFAGVSDAIKNTTLSSIGLAGGLAGVASSLTGMAVGGLVRAAKGLGELVSAGHAWHEEMQVFGPTIEKMAESIGHLASMSDLAAYRKKLMRGEIQLTEEQLISFTKAADILAKKMGMDLDSSLDRLNRGFQSATLKAFKPLGIEVNATSSLLERQQQILEGITRVTENYTSQIVTSRQKERAAEKELADETGKLGEAFNKLLGLESTAGIWSKFWSNSARTIRWDFGLLNKIITGYSEEITELSNRSANGLIALHNLGGGVVGLKGQLAELNNETNKTNAMFERLQKLSDSIPVAKRRTPKKKWVEEKEVIRKKGPARKKPGPDISDVAAQKASKQRMEDALERQDNAKRIDEELKRELEANEKLTTAFNRQDIARRQLLQREKETIAQHKKEYDAAKSLSDIYYNTDKQLKIFTNEGLQGLTEGLVSSSIAAIVSGESIGQAMLKVTKSVIMGIAQQAAVKALFELAEGMAALASIALAPTAPAHFVAAAKYAAVAGIGIGASIGLGYAESGDSGAAAKSARAAGSGTSEYRPTMGTTVEDKQPIYVNVYFGDPSDPGAKFISQRQVEIQLQKAGFRKAN